MRKLDIDMNAGEIWKDLIEASRVLSKTNERFDFPYSYIARQTGESEKKIKGFFALNPDNEEPEIPDEKEYQDYERIKSKISKLFQQEKKLNRYKLLDDDKFYELHLTLMREFNIDHTKLAELVREKIIDTETGEFKLKVAQIERKINHYDKLMEKGFFDYKIVDGKRIVEYTPLSPEKYAHIKNLSDDTKKELELVKNNMPPTSESKRHQKLKRINRQNITKANFPFSINQQRAILDVYFERCVDKNDYILPEHLGTGIRLAYMKDFSVRFNDNGEIRKPNFHAAKIKLMRCIKNPEDYNFGDTADKSEIYDTVYEFFSSHKRVFLYEPFVIHADQVFKKIKGFPEETQNQLYDWLDSEFSLCLSKKERFLEHFQTLSEYFDILSKPALREEISKCTKKQLYLIVYDICEKFNERFSYELVDHVFDLINLQEKDWLWKIYISNYYYRHREVDSIIKDIEKNLVENRESEKKSNRECYK